MKRAIAVVFLGFVLANCLHAEVRYVGPETMLAESDFIAMVYVQELVPIDGSGNHYPDFIATAHVEEALKGTAEGEITFHIQRHFTCSPFDASTGRHLVFLKMNKKGQYVTANGGMSYIPMAGRSTHWPRQGRTMVTPPEAVEDTRKMISASRSWGSQDMRKATAVLLCALVAVLSYLSQALPQVWRKRCQKRLASQAEEAKRKLHEGLGEPPEPRTGQAKLVSVAGTVYALGVLTPKKQALLTETIESLRPDYPGIQFEVIVATVPPRPDIPPLEQSPADPQAS